MTHTRNPALAYRAGFETTVSKPKIVQLLLDGAVTAIQRAIDAFQLDDFGKRIETIHNQATKAGAIISQLRAALDPGIGGEFAERLGSLYDYIGNQLIKGNIRKDPRLFEEAKSHLEVIQGAWKEMLLNASPALAVAPAGMGVDSSNNSLLAQGQSRFNLRA